MLVLGLLPLWILVYEVVAAPRAIEAVGSNPPAVAGLPVGFILVAIGLLVMAVGVVVLGRISSTRWTVLAFLGLTVPATVLVVIAPVLILMVQIWASRPPQ
jgi:hypothetical protein